MPSEANKKEKFPFSTTNFFRKRRPELFSDSVLVSRNPLTRELLEYHLETLTNRRQEYDFENFCRLIAQKEICPNILPQTGPLGGGDSQMDGSTYPVADEIAEQWHPYISRRAANELWAFAFSTKKQWRDKVRGDIAKIAALVPKPVRAYFITSQFVKDKARSELEKELRDKHGIDVHILDKNWLVTRVFENGHEALAVEALDMNIQAKPEKILGPRDAAREAELDELIRQLKEPEQLSSYPNLLVEEYLRAGRLSRSLEKPRYEVDGYFGQALRLAEQIGNQQQIIRVLYDQIWTAYWWFEDIDTLLHSYPRIEQLVFESWYTEDSELLHNLWCLLNSAYKHQHLSIEESLVTDAGQKLRNYLDNLAADDTRPNNAQYAKTIRLFHDLVSNGTDNENLPQILRDLNTCFKSSDYLPFFPVLAFVNLFTELGAVLGGLPEYDALFETVCSIAGKRDGEVRQGEMLYMRGIQQLQADRGNEALVTLGRARTKLAKAESLDVLVRATAACGLAYENLGLIWAARMDMLVAFELLMREYRTTGVLPSMTIHTASKMYWLELQLGRIAPCLAWYEVLQILRRVTGIKPSEEEKRNKEQMLEDTILGILFLKASLDDLPHLCHLPDVIERLGLFMGKDALLFALGYTALVEAGMPEGFFADLSMKDFFKQWREQPAAAQIPDTLILHSKAVEEYQTSVMGCQITLTVDSTPHTLLLAENILGVIEALFATATSKALPFFAPKIRIRVRSYDEAIHLPALQVNSNVESEDIEISASKSFLEDFTFQLREDFQKWMLRLFSAILENRVFDRVESGLEQLNQDSAFSRALSYSPTVFAVKSSLDIKKYLLTEWTLEEEQSYPLSRSTVWYEPKNQGKPKAKIPKISTNTTPKEWGYVPHRKRHIPDIIDIKLWNRAGWTGTFFLSHAADELPPLLGLVFRDAAAGRLIFQSWRQKLGQVDMNEIIRVAIIEGLDDAHSYSVHIGIEMEGYLKYLVEICEDERQEIMTMSRIQFMDRPNPENLRRFKASTQKLGVYGLIPAWMDAEGKAAFDVNLYIEKRKLHWLLASEIQPGEIDYQVLECRNEGT